MVSSPRFEVLDVVCLGGSPTQPNDDAYGATGRAALVLDGATGVGDAPLLPGDSDARWLAVEAASILTELANTASDGVATLVAKTVDQLITRFAASRLREPCDTYEIPFASLMLLAESSGQLEIGWYGDCRLLALGADGNQVTGGPGLKARAREQDRAREAATNSGIGAASMLRKDLLPQLRAMRNLANSRPGAGVLGPDPRCVPLLRREAIELALPATALLMSDGFYALVTDYQLYDDSTLLAVARRRGLAALYDELRAIESDDPQGTRFPRYKTHDDATAVLVSIQSSRSSQ
jgi:hypothetical protein